MTTYYAVRLIGGEVVSIASEYGPVLCVFADESDAVCCRESWNDAVGLDHEEYPLEIVEVQL